MHYILKLECAEVMLIIAFLYFRKVFVKVHGRPTIM